jgi:peroxiredoxin
MKKKLLLTFAFLAIAFVVAWAMAAPTEKIKTGAIVSAIKLTDIHGAAVSIPNPKTKWVHLQFRRFAGCPICNLHMQEFVRRHTELTAAGIEEVVVYHSPQQSLLPYQGSFPFAVIGDPEKVLYQQFGVGTSVFAILDVRAWPALKGARSGGPRIFSSLPMAKS